MTYVYEFCTISSLKLYSPALVLILWAFSWTINVRGPAVVGLGLWALGTAMALAEVERARLRREHHPYESPNR